MSADRLTNTEALPELVWVVSGLHRQPPRQTDALVFIYDQAGLVAQWVKVEYAPLMAAAPALQKALAEAITEFNEQIQVLFDSTTVKNDLASMQPIDRVEYDRLCALRDRCQAAIALAEGQS